MKLHFGRKTMMGAIGTLVAVGIGLAVIGAVGIVGWEYTNSDEFCAVMCHSVHPEESRVPQHRGARPRALRRVPHGPQFDAEADRDEAHALQGTVGHDRRLRAADSRLGTCARRARPARAATGRRPSTTTASRSTSATAPIRRAARSTTGLTLHTTANVEREIPWKVTGIHWHIANNVEFKSPDVQGADDSVGAGHEAGRHARSPTSTPNQSSSPAELGKLEPRRMECFNCHNAVGHPFPNPADTRRRGDCCRQDRP